VLTIAEAWRYQVCVENNVDYWGADLRNFIAKNFNHCASECARDSAKGCRSITYHKGSRRCYLKHTPFGATYKKSQSLLKSANLDCDKFSKLPSWPADFKWAFAGPPKGYTCVKIWEAASPAAHTWNDNFMCWRNDRADPGFRWSMAGAIPGQRCTQIIEGAEPVKYTWRDNFLCVQYNSPYHLSWTFSNALKDRELAAGKACIQWLEGADPHTWKDNYLCNKPYNGAYVSNSLPSWPEDFKWSNAGVPRGYSCDRIWELATPAKYTWKDNFFCWRNNKADPGIRFNMNGAVGNSDCVQLKEGAAKSWMDNFLCVPPTSPYTFSWVYSNALRDGQQRDGKKCIQWIEPADPQTWHDNYLCHYPLSYPDRRRHKSVQRRASSVGRAQVCTEDNVDYWGADLRNFRAKNFNHCAMECAKDTLKGCRSFTFHKKSGHCWLKHTPFGAKYTKGKNDLMSANLNCDSFSKLPSWPADFKWAFAGPPKGYTCVKIWEAASPPAHTWNDNFMCWRNDRADPGFRWSMAGPIPGQRCTQIIEGAEPVKYTWRDNYLCVQTNSPYHLSWTFSNALMSQQVAQGKKCIQWLEGADPHTWKDNYLCNKPYSGAYVYNSLPSWPEDFKWSNAGVPAGYHCDRIWELANPAQHTWKDNFFCWRNNKADPGIRFNMNGAVPNSHCVQIIEGAEPAKYTWKDNFLCVPPTSPYTFSWTYSNALRDAQQRAGKTCIQWREPADPHTWNDNYLCHAQVYSVDARRHRSNQW